MKQQTTIEDIHNTKNLNFELKGVESKIITNGFPFRMRKEAVEIIFNGVSLKTGVRVHLNSINGMYSIVRVFNTKEIEITARTWRGQTKIISLYDFKCLAGGINNIVRK